jgi:hypothetical protein
VATPSEQPEAPKKSKLAPLLTGFVLLCLGVAVLARFAGLYGSLTDQTDEANNLSDQANVSVEAMRKHSSAGAELSNKVLTEENVDGLPGTRAALKADAEKGAAEFMSAATEARKAADLMQQASEKKVNEHFQEYLSLKSKQFRVMGDVQEIPAKQLRLVSDESIADGAAFRAKLDEIAKPLDDLVAESKKLGEQADKVQADHPDVFVK